MQVEQLALVGPSFGGESVVREILGDGKSGDGEDIFLAHDAHGLVAKLKGVVYGFDAGASCVEGSGLAGSVDRHAISCASGLAHGCSEFVLGVLEGSRETAIQERV